MPYEKLGEKVNFDKNDLIVELKEKNDKITFRIIGGSYYRGQHFQQVEGGKWNVFDCPKIMQKQECEECDYAMKLYIEAKKMKEDGIDSKIVEAKKKEAQKHKPNVKWHYPALNRDTEDAMIFKVTLSTRNYLQEQVELGKDITKRDYILLVTKILPDYYKIDPVDSSDSKPLSPKELEQIEIAKGWDLESMVNGRKSSQHVTPEESEVPPPEEE